MPRVAHVVLRRARSRLEGILVPTPRSTSTPVLRLVIGLMAVLGMLTFGAVTAPAAAACPIDGCHQPPDDPTPNPGPQPPAPKYKLVIDKLHILDLQDTDGYDETIIKLDGVTKVANFGFPLGVNTLYAPVVKPSFTTAAYVEVREHNTNWWDDEIGTITFYPLNPPLPVGASYDNWADVRGSGAHYRLHFTLTRI